MNTRILKLASTSLLAAVISAMPLQLLAQTTNPPATEKKSAATKKEPGEKKKSAHPLRGKLAKIDQAAKTIQIGKSTYLITSQTKITKDGKPATLADAAVGDYVTGYTKPAEDGTMFASSLKIGAKGETKSADTKKKSK